MSFRKELGKFTKGCPSSATAIKQGGPNKTVSSSSQIGDCWKTVKIVGKTGGIMRDGEKRGTSLHRNHLTVNIQLLNS